MICNTRAGKKVLQKLRFQFYNCEDEVVNKNNINHTIREAVRKFPELWYSTLMVGHTTTLA